MQLLQGDQCASCRALCAKHSLSAGLPCVPCRFVDGIPGGCNRAPRTSCEIVDRSFLPLCARRTTSSFLCACRRNWPATLGRQPVNTVQQRSANCSAPGLCMPGQVFRWRRSRARQPTLLGRTCPLAAVWLLAHSTHLPCCAALRCNASLFLPHAPTFRVPASPSSSSSQSKSRVARLHYRPSHVSGGTHRVQESARACGMDANRSTFAFPSISCSLRAPARGASCLSYATGGIAGEALCDCFAFQNSLCRALLAKLCLPRQQPAVG